MQDPYLFLQNNIINSLALDVRHQETVNTDNAYIKKSQNIYSLLHTRSTTHGAVEAFTVKTITNVLSKAILFYIDIPKINQFLIFYFFHL